METIKPLIKCVGGKTDILPAILDIIPDHVPEYHELFVGGGCVLLNLLHRGRLGSEVHAYDINVDLINMYRNISEYPGDVHDNLEMLYNEYNSCTNGGIDRNPRTLQSALDNKENYYYWIRKQYIDMKNRRDTLCTAYFIFLNRTCFRGLHRTGPNGFNVPYGHYKTVYIPTKAHIMSIHNLIHHVNFHVLSYEDSIPQLTDKSFAYMDPPYVPVKKTSFTQYMYNNFNHEKLLSMIRTIPCRFVLHNSNTPLIHHHLDDTYTKETILCKRRINSSNPAAKETEVIIRNF
jgi:DNA adenine methylase